MLYFSLAQSLGVISSEGRDHSSWSIRPVSKVIPNTVTGAIEIIINDSSTWMQPMSSSLLLSQSTFMYSNHRVRGSIGRKSYPQQKYN